MTPEQFDMIEQTILDVHNSTVIAISQMVKGDNTDTRNTIMSQRILETFLFKNLNELREFNTSRIINLEAAQAS